MEPVRTEVAEVCVGSDKISTRRNVSADEIVGEAIAIYNEARAVNPLDKTAVDNAYNRLKDKYKDFAYTYPIVLHWIITTRQFHPEPFRRFVLYYAKLMFKNREESIKAQIKYIIFFYQFIHPEADRKTLKKMKKEYVDAYLETHKKFMSEYESIKDELKKVEENNDKNRRDEIYNYLKGRN
ncbi:Uncharacterised protein [uncultured archaeon]|nr:Uncharacterised protein [uncultured archaeon]